MLKQVDFEWTTILFKTYIKLNKKFNGCVRNVRWKVKHEQPEQGKIKFKEKAAWIRVSENAAQTLPR